MIRPAAVESPMKRTLMMMTTLLLVLALPAEAARKACDELKQEIAAKIDANGVKAYSLDVIAIDAAFEGKVVGTCDGGTQQIVYQRIDAAVDAKAIAKVD
jgi:hypothetical protein